MRTFGRHQVLFDALGTLENLLMGHNRLEELPQGLFDALGRLGSLDLRGNRLRHLPSATFRGLQRVTGIDVSANNISHPGIGAGTFANPDLAFVSLAHNLTPTQQHLPLRWTRCPSAGDVR